MVYHENKYISLGSGDVSVGSTWTSLTFQTIKPPQEIGTHLFRGQDGVEFLGEIVHLEFKDLPDLNAFGKQLRKAEAHETDCIEFGGWKLYFLPGSDKSIEVVRVHFSTLTTRMCQCLAC